MLNDFEPVAMLSTSSALDRRAQQGLPAKDLQGADRLAQGQSRQGHRPRPPGSGSGIHMCLVYFQNMTGTKFQLVPYRGAAPRDAGPAGRADRSVMSGQAGRSLPQVRAGQIKAYAVLTEERWFAAPDVPTIDEAGVPGLLHFRSGTRMWAPKGTPKDVIAKLNAAVVETLADPGVRQRFDELGPGDRAARAADAGGARRLPQGRDRQVVADHQGCEHQAGMTVPKPLPRVR